MVDWEAAKNTTEAALGTAEDKAKEYWYGNDNSEVIVPEGTETLAPQACYHLLDTNSQMYWEVVFVMTAWFFLTILVPYVLCCCAKKCVSWQARWYYMSALLFLIMGSLCASVLMPECPLDCASVCNAHKYNPGPVWGVVMILVSFIFVVKGCCTSRYATKLANEDAAKTAAERIPMTMSHEEGGYSDTPHGDQEII